MKNNYGEIVIKIIFYKFKFTLLSLNNILLENAIDLLIIHYDIW